MHDSKGDGSDAAENVGNQPRLIQVFANDAKEGRQHQAHQACCTNTARQIDIAVPEEQPKVGLETVVSVDAFITRKAAKFLEIYCW